MKQTECLEAMLKERPHLLNLNLDRFKAKWKMHLLNQDQVNKPMTPDAEMHKQNLIHSCNILGRLPLDKFKKVLNLGCGAGEAEALRLLGYEVTGMTLGWISVAYSQKVYNLSLIYGDMHDIPFPNETFDAVVCKHSFEHAYAPFMVATEIYCVLRTGGRWFSAQPNPHHDPGCSPAHPSVLTVQQREELFKRLDFTVIKNVDEMFLVEKPPQDGSKPVYGIAKRRAAIHEAFG